MITSAKNLGDFSGKKKAYGLHRLRSVRPVLLREEHCEMFVYYFFVAGMRKERYQQNYNPAMIHQ